jgi:predicted DCC family thiol-disulfide oxidoreductase YuxK
MPQTAKYDVFLDGSCSLCKWMRARIEPYDTGARLRFLDYNDSAVTAHAPFTHTKLGSEMHVRTPDGRWFRGYESWLVVLRVLPKLAWLGWIGDLPLVRSIGASAYRFIARHRYSLPGAPPRCDGDTCALPRQRTQ